jgi:hypothetical protein
MQELRRVALVVCLLVGMAAGSARTVPSRTHRAGKMDDGILATILDLLGVTLDNKVSIPPG